MPIPSSRLLVSAAYFAGLTGFGVLVSALKSPSTEGFVGLVIAETLFALAVAALVYLRWRPRSRGR